MSARKEVIADVNHAPVEDVCCRKCRFYKPLGNLIPWCRAWDMNIMDSDPDEGFCSLWAAERTEE